MVGFKTVLLPFGGKFTEVNTLETGFVLAKSFLARLQVLHISPDPRTYIANAYQGVSTPIVTFEGFLEEIEEHTKTVQEDTKRLYHKSFEQYMTKNDGKESGSAFFNQEIGNAKDIISTKGRMSDLIIMSTTYENDNTNYDGSTIGALFNTGRPVLLIPPHSHLNDIKNLNIVIAWNGSTEAMRAVTLSLPILQHAKKIYVLSVHEGEEDLPVPSEELSLYLKQHDIKVDLLEEHGSDIITTEVIFNKVKEKEADMVIMGAYSHNRLWETFFGGVTDFILKNTTVPILMAH